MEIIYKKPKDLIPYEFNNKNHPDDQINKIANSINEFGFTQPIVIDSNNIVVIGHGRLMAGLKLGIDKVPCVVMDGLDEKQIARLRIIDNRLNESEWNIENLKIEIENIGDDDLKVEFEDLFVDDIDLDAYKKPEEKNPDEDEEGATPTIGIHGVIQFNSVEDAESAREKINELGYSMIIRM